ncbi:MAG: YifB family Mg chelatase-like AAA ATPase [Treponema sp.]
MQIYSFSPFGYEGSLVTVEVDLRRGIPAVDLVGLADGAVKEARERMQAAVRNSGFDFPPERILISLSPADLKKEGAGFDLPIALAVLRAKKLHDEKANAIAALEGDAVLVMGELELSGRIRSVRGVHAAASTAAANGITRCIVPSSNAQEAREVQGVRVFGAETLKDAFSALYDESVFCAQDQAGLKDGGMTEAYDDVFGVLFEKQKPAMEFSDVKGQTKLVRALQIAAAGGHNLLAGGAPGCGKTMAIQKTPALLPLLTPDQAHPVTRIYSLAGLLPQSTPVIRAAPFRTPHQSASMEGICGGGKHCRPGEISLSHKGVLFLDEAAEFKSSVLQILRVPLETGSITLARAGRSTVYPAEFRLFMAANPCPCGNFGSKTKTCLCSARSIELYWRKFSAPLLDRIDLRVFVENESRAAGEKTSVSTAELRKGIARAVIAQRTRQQKCNASLTQAEIQQFCATEREARAALDKAVSRYELSPRAEASCLKTARTIADIDGAEAINAAHIKEAIDFRKTFNDFMQNGGLD